MGSERFAVVYGGPSAEHDVSLKSGQAVVDALRRLGHQVDAIRIDKSGMWEMPDGKKYDLSSALGHLRQTNYRLVVLGLHGTFGEDGVIQGLLESNMIPFSGSGSSASMLAMNKQASNAIYELNGLTIPKTVIVHHEDKLTQSPLPLPVIVKPTREGSSMGVHLVREPGEFLPALEDAFEYDAQVLIQTFIVGREVSCGVLQLESGLRALPPTELLPMHSPFFDYEAKYTPGGAQEITPPNMSSQTIQSIQDIAVMAHTRLGCRDYSRTDMIVSESGDIYVIETNTLPGMTAQSILPQQAAAIGMDFDALVSTIIASALKRTAAV